jgi:hypothetical protein
MLIQLDIADNTPRRFNPKRLSGLRQIYELFNSKVGPVDNFTDCNIRVILYVCKFLLSHVEWCQINKRSELLSKRKVHKLTRTESSGDKETSHQFNREELQILIKSSAEDLDNKEDPYHTSRKFAELIDAA